MTHPTQSAAIQEQEINLQQFLLILRRRYPYLIAIFFVMILFSGVYSYRQTPLYQGSALLIFEPNKQSPVDFANTDLGKVDQFLETQKRIITSRKVIGRVLNALNVSKPSQQENNGGLLKTISELIKLPILFHTDKKNAVESDPINTFRQKISVQLLRNTNLMQLQVSDSDPDKAALYTNTLAKIYIAYALADLRASSTDSFTWLTEQVTLLKAKVKKSELDLLKYKQEEELTSIEKKQTMLDDKIAELNNNLSKLALQRMEKESILGEIKSLSDKLHINKNIPEVLENSQIKLLKEEYNKIDIELARLSTKFKKNHPERIRLSTQLSFIKEKISSETEKVIKDLEIDYRILQTKETALKNSLQTFKKKAQKIAEQAIEYGVLKREAETNNQLYNVLLERLKETDVGSSIIANNIRIVDQAEPPNAPFTPNIPRNLLLAGVLGLFLGTGSCFLIEYFDNTIKNQDDLELLTGLDLIGAIPESKTPISLGEKMDEQVIRGYRETKTILDFYRKEHLLKTLMVTSTLPKEGKTSTVLGLGISYAQAGAKVLMVDSDIFKPRLNKILGLTNKTGLFNYFYKEVPPTELVMETEQENLFLLSTGLIPPNPVDLITSEKMKQLMKQLTDTFDLILIDTPPLTVSNGIAVLASYLDGVAFVVRAHSTSYQASTTALKALQKVNANPIGALLTRTRKHHAYGYGYRYDYRSNNIKKEVS